MHSELYPRESSCFWCDWTTAKTSHKSHWSVFCLQTSSIATSLAFYSTQTRFLKQSLCIANYTLYDILSIENTLLPVPLLKVLVCGGFELSLGQYWGLGSGLVAVLVPVQATGEETRLGLGQSRSWPLKQTQSRSWFGHLFGPVEVSVQVSVLKYWVSAIYDCSTGSHHQSRAKLK